MTNESFNFKSLNYLDLNDYFGFCNLKFGILPMSKKILIIAGEPSADLHGASLIKAILAKSPDTKFIGMGGELMKTAGANLYYDLSKISVIGFAEVIKKLPLYKKIFNGLSLKLDSEKPDAVCLIDYPGFNLRFAKEAKKRHIPVIYYISPQVWAWHKGRIKTIKQIVDKMLVFFEFEKALYEKHGINAAFVGHPLIESVKPSMAKNDALKKFKLTQEQKIIALLPGSRQTEVRKVLPIMLKSAEIIANELCHSEGAKRPKNLKREILRPFGAQDDTPVQFIIIKSSIVGMNVYEKILCAGAWGHPAGSPAHFYTKSPHGVPTVSIIDDNRYDAVNISDFALVASGTATLETAILGVPMALVYKVSFLTWFLARILIKIPYIGLVNVVAEEKIIPEFIQFGANPKKIAGECIDILQSPARISKIKIALAQVKEKLGPSGASANAASEILAFLDSDHANTGIIR